MGKNLIGSLLRAYTATEYATKGEDCPRVGYVFDDEQSGKRYIFVKNTGASALAENKCCSPATGAEASYEVALSTALNGVFAGVRPDGATQLAQNEYGYVQIAGPATFTVGDTAAATVADTEIVLDDDTDGGNVGGADLDISATVNEANAEATTNAVLRAFAIAHSAVSTTDAEVVATIFKNCWGR